MEGDERAGQSRGVYDHHLSPKHVSHVWLPPHHHPAAAAAIDPVAAVRRLTPLYCPLAVTRSRRSIVAGAASLLTVILPRKNDFARHEEVRRIVF